MKKRYLFIMIILFISIGLFILLMGNDNENDISNSVIVKNDDSLLSMMIEQTSGAGDYKLETRSSWPTSGYVFNITLSKCENGGELSWDDTNKVVAMTGNVSDKCYVYFDIVPPTLTEYIKGLYTTQGTNNIYHHDGNLTNGAGDGSYRYAWQVKM